MKKSGFSLAEFVVSIMFMFITMGVIGSVPLKKAKMTKHNLKQDGVVVCTCANPKDVEEGCLFEIDTTGRHEFYTIQLLGGGASGGVEKGGAAGEGKIIHYPTLSGRYFVKLGKGGIYSSNPSSHDAYIHGGTTTLYKVLESGALELVEFARGGAAGPIETIDQNALTDVAIIDELKKGEKPTFGTTNEVNGATITCGAGGNALENGQPGEVIIKW